MWERVKAKRTVLLVSAGVVVLGAVLVLALKEKAPDPSDSHPSDEPQFGSAVERGEYLYRMRACASCHGERAQGGVENENYVLGTVPALDEMADRLMLFEPEDAELVISMIEEGRDPAALRSDPPFPGYQRFLAQLEVVTGIIEDGAPAAKRDEDGPVPPLQMPGWGTVLTDEEIRAVIAYLVSLYDWDALDNEGWAEDEAMDGGDDSTANPE